MHCHQKRSIGSIHLPHRRRAIANGLAEPAMTLVRLGSAAPNSRTWSRYRPPANKRSAFSDRAVGMVTILPGAMRTRLMAGLLQAGLYATFPRKRQLFD